MRAVVQLSALHQVEEAMPEDPKALRRLAAWYRDWAELASGEEREARLALAFYLEKQAEERERLDEGDPRS